jgi:ABC-type multidrug transport system ATPase subunit
LGDNGAGKSTLVRQIANLIQATSGSIRLYGLPVGNDALFVPQRIGHMSQDDLALDACVLILFSIPSTWLASRKMDWSTK